MKIITITTGLILTGILAVLAYVFLFQTESAPPPEPPDTTNPFGQQPGTTPGTVASTTPGELPILEITARDGTAIAVPDFTQVNQPTNANANNGYQIAGSNTGTFQILFFPNDSGILVSLFSEPIGPVRLEAEEALRTVLGLTNQELCRLNHDVRTIISVNETYAGRSLGFSFCPGATVLPN